MLSLKDVRFLNTRAEIKKHRKNLPHWQQEEATYFVTFRLADSVPASLLAQWRQERSIWLKLHPEPWTEATEDELGN